MSTKKDAPCRFERVDENTWKIKDANKVAKISYWVDDTWDTEVEGPEIFWPAGTNIEEQTNYVMNTSGFFGYFAEAKEVPFRFKVVRPQHLYGSTGLIPVETGAPINKINLEKSPEHKNSVVDVYEATDYDHLIDSPLMYSKPDTAVIRVANTEVLIGSYSPNNQVSAREIAESVREVLMAQKEYLGGELPVDKYAFIFYFTDQPVQSYGALEHSYSSLYFMPEATIDQLNQQLREVAAHEFFHILTPPTVHSGEIEDFDFNNPDMSKHLWMYEGVTEYFAGHVLVRHDLIDIGEFIGILREKMFTADHFRNDVPFTEISEFTLDKYHDQYYNVYQKGALIALCLDIRLRELSGGEKGLRDLMLALSERFGINKPFDDDELFTIITEMTYPEIGDFLNRYVGGAEPLPLKEAFDAVGIIYEEEGSYMDYSLGIGNDDIGVIPVEGKPKLYITTTDNLNPMGKALGFQQGDVIVAINNDTLPDLGPELGMFLQQKVMELPQTDTLSYTVMRTDSTGQSTPVVLSAPVQQVELTERHIIMPNENATEKQLALRKAWLEP